MRIAIDLVPHTTDLKVIHLHFYNLKPIAETVSVEEPDLLFSSFVDMSKLLTVWVPLQAEFHRERLTRPHEVSSLPQWLPCV